MILPFAGAGRLPAQLQCARTGGSNFREARDFVTVLLLNQFHDQEWGVAKERNYFVLRGGIAAAVGMVVLTAASALAEEVGSFKVPGWAGGLCFNPRGDLLALACSDRLLRIRSVKTGEERTLFGHSNCVVAVAFSPEGTSMATGSYDRSAKIWDLESGTTRFHLLAHQGAVMTVAYAPDGKLLATGSIDGTIKLWESNSGKLVSTFEGHKSWVNSVYFPDGTTLASGSSDGTVKFWNIESLKLERTIDVTPSEVRSIAFTAGGKCLAAGIRYGGIRIFRGETGTSWKGHEGDVWSLAFTPGGKALISGDGDWDNPGQVKFWDPQTGKLLISWPHRAEVLSLACSPDGRLVAAAARDGSVKVWSMPRL